MPARFALRENTALPPAREKSALISAANHPPLSTIPFTIRTFAKSARNSCGMRSFKTRDLKSFGMCSYEKTGGGVRPGRVPLTESAESCAHPTSRFRTVTAVLLARPCPSLPGTEESTTRETASFVRIQQRLEKLLMCGDPSGLQ